MRRVVLLTTAVVFSCGASAAATPAPHLNAAQVRGLAIRAAEPYVDLTCCSRPLEAKVIRTTLDRSGKELVWRSYVYARQFRFDCDLSGTAVCVPTFTPYALVTLADATGRVVSVRWAGPGGVPPRLGLGRTVAIAVDAVQPYLSAAQRDAGVQRLQIGHIGTKPVWLAQLHADAFQPLPCVPPAHCGMPSFLTAPTEARVTIDDATGRILSVGLVSSDLPLCRPGQSITPARPCSAI